MPKIILHPDVQRQVDEIIAPLQNPEMWKAMELSFAPNPYAIVRLEGAPGTGKTALAQLMARRLKQPPMEVSFDKVASGTLGDTEKSINALFEAAATTETKTIIMEECDALLWSRSMVGEDTTYMLGFINTLLTNIDKFIKRPIPSLLILTSNHPEKLDAALESRVTDVIKLFPPVGQQAWKLWHSKFPTELIHSTTQSQINKLTEIGATPRQMEQAILKICRRAVKEGRQPKFEDFGL